MPNPDSNEDHKKSGSISRRDESAVARSSEQRLRDLLDLAKGAGSQELATHSCATLREAAWSDHSRCVLRLVKSGATVDKLDKFGWTPLGVAADRNSAKAARALLQSGADVNAEQPAGNLSRSTGLDSEPVRLLLPATAGHVAAAFGHVDILADLIQHGWKSESRTGNGETALHIAAWRGQVESVNFLVRNVADVNTKDRRTGATALHWASASGNHEVVQILVASGAKTEAKDNSQHEFMDWAADAGTEKLGIAVGAAMHGNLKTDPDTAEVLHFAGRTGRLEAVKSLVDSGIDPDARDTLGMTLLQRSALGNRLDLMKCMLSFEINPDIPMHKGFTPLEMACSAGNVDAAAILLENGASLEGLQPHRSPLMYACWKGNLDVVRFLLSKGASKDGKIFSYYSRSGSCWKTGHYTPLHYAVRAGNGATVKLLLTHGVDTELKDSQGQTAAQVAERLGEREIVDAIDQHFGNLSDREIEALVQARKLNFPSDTRAGDSTMVSDTGKPIGGSETDIYVFDVSRETW
jgi:ankyrin repeat protein